MKVSTQSQLKYRVFLYNSKKCITPEEAYAGSCVPDNGLLNCLRILAICLSCARRLSISVMTKPHCKQAKTSSSKSALRETSPWHFLQALNNITFSPR